jgi:hypothetical protein
MAIGNVALIREQGVEFAVVCVTDSVIEDQIQRARVQSGWRVRFRRPVVLLGSRQHALFGREDLVRFLRRTDVGRLPWRQVGV